MGSTPQFNISVPHKDHTFSVPKIPQFNTKNPSVQHTRSVPQQNFSVQTKTPQFYPPSVPHQKPISSKHPLQFHTKNPSEIFTTELLIYFLRVNTVPSTLEDAQCFLPMTTFRWTNRAIENCTTNF